MLLATGLKAGHEKEVSSMLKGKCKKKTTKNNNKRPPIVSYKWSEQTHIHRSALRQIGSWKLLFMRSNLKITSIYSTKLVLNKCWSRKENKAVKSMINTSRQINSINSKNRLHSTLVRTLKWETANQEHCKYVWNVAQRML